ncbi:MAG: tRNA-dihydrouridine synthase family protein [Eubacteriales bacterium]|nr:tRNA-dihydrouridine synthase family protein [Eubacteriales bacterium]
MQFYFAPLEGIGGHIFRNVYAGQFGGIDKYFAPFIAAGPEVHYHKREIRDVLPENNCAKPLIPQILTNHSSAFLATADVLEGYGYEEINLNLGCPSRTVVSKGKGAGFLAHPDELDRFLEVIFNRTNLKISVKTRIGMDSKEELAHLMEIFNRYPVHELIIHPRIQKDYYNNTPDWEKFSEALAVSRHSVCYNGDIFTAEDYMRFTESFPGIDKIMIGRGILANPALIRELRGEELPDKAFLRKYHDALLEEYQRTFSGDKNVLFKMKELWCYMIYIFDNHQKYAKKIRKAQKMPAYLEAVDKLFGEQEVDWHSGFRWEK